MNVTNTKKVINIDLLQNKKRLPDGSLQAACPCCKEQGNDKDGTHLRIWPDLKFNCITNTGDRLHNKRILQLLGVDIGEELLDLYIRIEEPKVDMPKSWDISVLAGLVKNYDYWNKRGISNETCEYFKIGVAIKGMMDKRSVIPILDKNNPKKIVGFTGRTLRSKEEIDKYNIVKWKHIGEKAEWLMPAIDEEIIKAKSVILVESPGCFLTLFENKIKNTICLFGTEISSKIMGYLLSINPDKIIIATNNEPDNNNIGNRAALKIKKQLLSFFNVEKIIVGLPYKKDFNLMSIEEIQKYKEEFLNDN